MQAGSLDFAFVGTVEILSLQYNTMFEMFVCMCLVRMKPKSNESFVGLGFVCRQVVHVLYGFVFCGSLEHGMHWC